MQLNPTAAQPCVNVYSELGLANQRVVRVSADVAITQHTPGNWVGLVLGRDKGGFVTSPDHVGLYVTNQNGWVLCYNGQCNNVAPPGSVSGDSHRLTLEVQNMPAASPVLNAWVDDTPAIIGKPLTAGLSDRNATVYSCGAGETASVDNFVVTGVPERSAIGALRWDAWFESQIDTPQFYHFAYWLRTIDTGYWDRIPFWATKINDNDFYFDNTSQASVDQEIRYASTALDFWTFLYYNEHDSYHNHLNHGLRSYLASEVRDDVSYALMIGNLVFCDNCPGGNKEPVNTPWSTKVDEIVSAMRKPSYHRVLGSRPLLYVFEQIESSDVTQAKLSQLRAAISNTGLGEPYIVALAPRESDFPTLEARGYDAVSSYSSQGENYIEAKGFIPDQPHSYRGLAMENHNYWRDYVQRSRIGVLPTANVGWDCRPRDPVPTEQYDHCGGAYDATTPGDIASQALTMLQWSQLNPIRNPSRSTLLYAWNELDEGGWLVPTMLEGSARVDRLTEGLNSRIQLRDTFNLDAFEQFQGHPGIESTTDLNLERAVAYTGAVPTRQIGERGGNQTAIWNSTRSTATSVQLRRVAYGNLTGAMALYPNAQEKCVNAYLGEDLSSLPDLFVSLDVSASKLSPDSWIGIVVGPKQGAFVNAPGHASFYIQNNGSAYYWRDGDVRAASAAGSYPDDLHHLSLRSQRSGSAHSIRVESDGQLVASDNAAGAVTPTYLTVWACGQGEAFGVDSVSIQTPW
ncbi:MAG: hypothetical protein ACREP7_06560 [Lysobacter sp.]